MRASRFPIKQAFALHGRLGAGLAVPIVVVLLTGTLAVFGPELDALFYPCVSCPTARRGQLDVPWSRLEANARHVLPTAVPRLLNAPEEDGRSAWALVEVAPHEYRHVFFDPHDGRVLGVGPYRMPRRLLRDLHRSWLLGETFGVFLVTSLSLVLVTSVVSGLRFWSKRGPRAPLRAGHRALSVALLPFLAVLIATGVWYWGELLGSFVELRPTGDVPRMTDEEVARVQAGEPTLDVDSLVAIAEGAWPELEIHAVAYASEHRPVFSAFGAESESALMRDQANQIFVNPYDGTIMGITRASELSPIGWWANVVDAIHFGTWGGIASRSAYLVSGLLVLFLPLSGAWVRRRRLQAALRKK